MSIRSPRWWLRFLFASASLMPLLVAQDFQSGSGSQSAGTLKKLTLEELS
jgi:hypothetical protein